MKANIAKDIASLAVPLDKLSLLPGNPRRGDVDSIKRSYSRFGQRKPVVAVGNAEDGGYVSDGNHQLLAARDLGWDTLAVVWTDDDKETAEAYALAANRTSELGTNDNSDLLAMLLRVTSADTELLAAASYGHDDLADILRRIETDAAPPLDPFAEWEGMPAFTQNDMMSKFHVVVHFASDEDCDNFFETIDRQRRSSMWWPSGRGLEVGAFGEQYVEKEDDASSSVPDLHPEQKPS